MVKELVVIMRDVFFVYFNLGIFDMVFLGVGLLEFNMRMVEFLRLRLLFLLVFKRVKFGDVVLFKNSCFRNF